ncbi:FlaD/FlaE family flagellar protein, partial [Metallibacterium scheffleri]|uniref:FlaD/FlaE family flagellar protein n=1 Tax=Metallibacterium scheffleri TaxID=993689 RepID=UPI0023F315B7
QRIVNSQKKFSKDDIDALFQSITENYSAQKEKSLVGKVDKLFDEISAIEKMLTPGKSRNLQDSDRKDTEKKPKLVERPFLAPKLEKVGDDVVSLVIALRWLEFLLDNYGPENTLDVLDYYENLGWISSTVKEQMTRFTKMTGMLGPVQEYKIKPTIQDHVITMLFIEKLNGVMYVLDEPSIGLHQRDNA